MAQIGGENDVFSANILLVWLSPGLKFFIFWSNNFFKSFKKYFHHRFVSQTGGENDAFTADLSSTKSVVKNDCVVVFIFH